MGGKIKVGDVVHRSFDDDTRYIVTSIGKQYGQEYYVLHRIEEDSVTAFGGLEKVEEV